METITITKENYRQEVLESDRPVLLDFWAGWCGHCAAVSPVIEEIARENNQIKVGKVNVDEQAELAKEFHVMGIPLLAVVKEGRVTSRKTGALPKSEILSML